MSDILKLTALGLIFVMAAIASNFALDQAYQLHAILILFLSAGLFVWQLRKVGEPKPATPTGYMDDVVRAGVIATALWGVAAPAAVGLSATLAFGLYRPAYKLGCALRAWRR